MFGVLLHQCDLLRLTAGQFQIINGLLVDVEHSRRCAVFRAHIGNGRAVANRQAVGAIAEKFHIGANHALFAQKFGQGQDDVGRGDAGLTFASELHANNVRQTHHGRAAEHDGFGFQTTHANRNHAQGIHMRRVAVGADAGVGEGNAVAVLNHRRHFFEVDLVHDAVARRNHVDVFKRGRAPVDEVETVFVAAIFDVTVFLEGVGVIAAAFHRQRVVDDQLRLHHRIDFGRIAALIGNRIAQTGQIHQGGLAENVVAHHAGREPREINFALALDQLVQPFVQGGGIGAVVIGLAYQLLGQHAAGVGQTVVGAGFDGVNGGLCVVKIDSAVG